MLHPDPFRDIDRLAAQLLGTSPGSARVPLAMPMDLYRSGDHYVLHADLPGVDPDSVDVSVDGGILTVKAQRSERTERRRAVAELRALHRRFHASPVPRCGHRRRPHRRHLSERGADRNPPVAARAKPRRIEITHGAREETKVIEPSDSSDQHTTT